MNPTPVTPERVASIHKLFVELTGRELILDLAGYRSMQWAEWFSHGYTEQDLRDVVAYIRKGIMAGRRHEGALKFVNLIGDSMRFGDDLAELRAQEKQRTEAKDQARERVLRQSGRPPETKYVVTPAGEAAFRELQKLKEKL